MRKRCIAGILLAALLVSLCGCTSVFDKEYLSVRPYEEPSNLLTDADTTQIRNYAGLMRALNTMAAQYERSFVLAFGDYDGRLRGAAHRHRHRRVLHRERQL